MFKDFDSYTDGPAGLMKLMAVSEPALFHAYKERLVYAEEFRSIVVFPEQLIGFSGRLFIVRISDSYAEGNHKRNLMARYVDVTGILQNNEYLKEDEQVDYSKPIAIHTGGRRIEQFIIDNEFKFVKRKHAARFAAKMAGLLFGEF